MPDAVYLTHNAEIMRLFDALPQAIRDCLNASPYSPHPDDINGIYYALQRGYTADEIVRMIQASNAKRAARNAQ